MSSDPTALPVHGEILTGVQRRRRWSTTEKIRLVEESQQPGPSVSFVVRPYGISPSLLFSWKRRMLEGGHQAVYADEEVVGTSRVRELERRVRDLEHLPGRKTMEVEILKEALDLGAQKTDLAAQLVGWFDGRFAVKAVADTLGVARSHLAERPSGPARPRGPYSKPEDARLLPTIRAIVDARPSYVDRRVTALVNRMLRSRGEASVNAKRVLRILRANGLTLAPHTARRPGRAHDGIVAALRSNVERAARITWNCAAGTMRSCGCCLPSTPATARSWRGRRP